MIFILKTLGHALAFSKQKKEKRKIFIKAINSFSLVHLLLLLL